ncbi:ATP synthase protein I [Senna tora]|uniref:ATP synthase protein I n=1 Tax=Senna tora TaxID=362788 RepID=A0A834W4Q2_9FABA|nr:ATP synthase protein I [Senna tora]
MDSLSRIRCFPAYCTVQHPRIPASARFRSSSFTRRSPLVSVLRAGPPSVSDVDEDVLQIFLKERELNSDFISRASDLLWQRKFRNSVDSNSIELVNAPQQTEQSTESNNNDGFLKLSRTQEWILGDNTAPLNKKAAAKVLQDSSERRKKLNILKYESLKREILLLSVGIGVACSGYCLITLSVQAAISYAIGVLFSCLYLQLLYQHADNLSSESVPKIFTKKKTKKIGIRSEDLQDFLERSIKGTSISLSSPRLVIPAAIFGLWIVSHKYFANDLFDFQIVPAMFGMFVYKAAVLVQVYRDNEDLQLVFPENQEGSSD